MKPRGTNNTLSGGNKSLVMRPAKCSAETREYFRMRLLSHFYGGIKEKGAAAHNIPIQIYSPRTFPFIFPSTLFARAAFYMHAPKTNAKVDATQGT